MRSLMRIGIALMVMTTISCNGKLTDEQRHKLNEGMKMNRVRKVSDALLTEAAFSFGRNVAIQVGDPRAMTIAKKDSLERLYKIRIDLLLPGDKSKNEIEKQIAEAYTVPSSGGEANDNVQKIGVDSILYTKPFYSEDPAGPMFTFAVGIRTSRKQIVMSIKE